MKAFYRKSDLVTRIDGEQLLITLLDSDLTDTLLFCKRLHPLIANIKINDSALPVIIVVSTCNETISLIDSCTKAKNIG